ncbi:MAG: hypothetical protein O3A85_08235 [Proteobacteria bacterium]|nr:hypothetical protein [Pseudomonadota bacterium]
MRKTESGIHVDGYPTADRVVRMVGKQALKLAALRLHESDLKFCHDAMQQLGLIDKLLPTGANNKSDMNAHTLRTALWTSILVKYFSCFGSGKRSLRLNAEDVLKDEAPEALEIFQFFKDLRDKHIVHDVNNYNYSETGAVLEADGTLLDILSVTIRVVDGDDAYQNMFNLIEVTRTFVSAWSEKMLSDLFAELGEISPNEILIWDVMEYEKPQPADIAKARNRATRNCHKS